MVRNCQKTGKCASPEVEKIANSISDKGAEDFAKTKHKGLPNKIKKKKSPFSRKEKKIKMNFKEWFLTEEYQSMSASIPMPDEIKILSDLFHKSGARLDAVGGAIRDYLYHIYHQKNKNIPYNPKDVDLATDAQTEKIIEILSSPEAVHNGIKVFPKGKSFGVISAIINGKEFEIATYRTEFYDSETGDGRRPDSVSFGTVEEDAKRRDLHINALFYNLHDKEIRDYNTDENGQGEGFKDILNKHVRVVGDPFERFREDKLRVLRLVRFFSRFNDDKIIKHLDPKTLAAVDNFKELKGVSGERIASEFLSGLKSCLSVEKYILNFKDLDLISVIFPGLIINYNELERLEKSRNSIAVMSYLFRNNDPTEVRIKLNKLKYSNDLLDKVFFIHDIPDTVSFILRIAYKLDKSNIIRMIRMKDNINSRLLNAFVEFGKISGMEEEMEYFINYTQSTNSEDYMHLQGKEISDKMGEDEFENYKKEKP